MLLKLQCSVNLISTIFYFFIFQYFAILTSELLKTSTRYIIVTETLDNSYNFLSILEDPFVHHHSDCNFFYIVVLSQKTYMKALIKGFCLKQMFRKLLEYVLDWVGKKYLGRTSFLMKLQHSIPQVY